MQNQVAIPEAQAVSQSPVVALPNSNAAAAQVYGFDSKPFFCSVPPTHPQYTEMLLKASFSNDGNLADMVGQEIDVRHIFGVRVDLVNERTGEQEEATRTVLITDDGKAYGCTSKGVAKSVALILQSKGNPDQWKESVRFAIRQVAARVGKMLVLVPVQKTAKGVAR